MKKFITRKDILLQLKQYCELNDINFEEMILNNPTNLAIAMYAFNQGLWVGRNGNKTFMDSTD